MCQSQSSILSPCPLLPNYFFKQLDLERGPFKNNLSVFFSERGPAGELCLCVRVCVFRAVGGICLDLCGCLFMSVCSGVALFVRTFLSFPSPAFAKEARVAC